MSIKVNGHVKYILRVPNPDGEGGHQNRAWGMITGELAIGPVWCMHTRLTNRLREICIWGYNTPKYRIFN